MAISLNTSDSSLLAARALQKTTTSISLSSQRLSTGNAINKAADDAARFAMASRMSVEVRSAAQALKNIMDAQSLISVVEGAYQGINNALQSMRELAVTASTDTLSVSERNALSAELSILSESANSLATNTEWNKTKLLDGSAQNLSFQTSTDPSSSSMLSIGFASATMEGIGISLAPSQRNSSIGVASIDGASIDGASIGTESAVVSVSAGRVQVSLPNKPTIETVAIGSEFQLNEPREWGDNWDQPSITYLHGGGFVATWSNPGVSAPVGIKAQIFDARGNAVGENFQVNSTALLRQDSASVKALNNGNFVVTWVTHNPDASRTILGQIFDPNGVRVGEEFVVADSPFHSLDPSLEALSGGGFVVTWTDVDASVTGLFAKLYDADGNAQGSSFQVNTSQDGYERSGSVAALEDGGFFVIWSRTYPVGVGAKANVYGQRYDANGAQVGSEISIGASPAYFPAASLIGLEDGGYLIAWVKEVRTSLPAGRWQADDQVWAQRYDANDAKIGAAFNVGASPGAIYNPVLASLSDGGFVVTWSKGVWGSGASTDVYMQRYDSDGERIGEQTRVNTWTHGGQYVYSISGSSDGEFVVSYRSPTDIRFGNTDVLAQRFSLYSTPLSVSVEGHPIDLNVGGSYDGNSWNYFSVAADIADAINSDETMQAWGYSAVAATQDQVDRGLYVAGDVILLRTEPGASSTASGSDTTTQNGQQEVISLSPQGAATSLTTAQARTITLATRAGAEAAITSISMAIETLNKRFAELGALGSRLSYQADNLVNSNIIQATALSRVLDANYAADTSNLAREMIINKAASAMLVQANASYQDVLMLIN